MGLRQYLVARYLGSGASLRGAALPGARLTGAKLRSADLSEADLRGANLEEADLSGADLRGANLGEADLARSHLGGTQLERVVMVGAYLRGADLQDASLEEADLRDAALIGANLQGASLTQVRLSGARYDGDTRWPEGFDPEECGAVRVTSFDPTTFDRVKRVIVEHWKVNEAEVTPTALLWEDVLQDDDLRSVEVIMSLEAEFGFEIPDDEVERFSTVADVVTYVKLKEQR